MPIYDQSYAHWKGRLEGHVFRWFPITTNGIRLVFRKKMLLILLGLALIPFLIRLGMVVLYHYFETLFEETPDADFVELARANGEFYHNFLMTNQILSVIAICLFMGAPLIARDLKVGAMEVYFSKPILLVDYVVGKFMVVAFFLSCVTLIPALFIFFIDVLLAEREGHFSEALPHLPGILAVSMLLISSCSVLVLASSALSRTARTAAIIWFGFHMSLLIVSKISAEIFSNRNLELLDPQTSLRYLSSGLFGLRSVYTWHTAIPFCYLILITLAALWIIFRRVKGVEVVK